MVALGYNIDRVGSHGLVADKRRPGTKEPRTSCKDPKDEAGGMKVGFTGTQKGMNQKQLENLETIHQVCKNEE